MAWEPITFVPTARLSTILSNAQGSLGGVPAALAAVGGQIAAAPALDASATGGRPALPLVGDSRLYTILTRHYKTVVIHPWCQGIGEGVGHYRNLSPANAVAAAAQKFVDANDAHKSTENMDAFCILLTGKSLADLHNKLTTFLTVCDHPELQLCAHRCGALATLEGDKEQLPEPPQNAAWRYTAGMAATSFRNYLAALGEAVALVDGDQAATQSAEAELAALADKKAARVNQVLATAQAAAQAWTGGIGQKWFIENKSPLQIKRALEQSGADHSAPLSVVVVFAGPTSTLTQLKGLFAS